MNAVKIHISSIKEKVELLKLQLKDLKIFSPEYNKLSDCLIKMLRLQGALTILKNNNSLISMGTEVGVIKITREFLTDRGFEEDSINLIESLV